MTPTLTPATVAQLDGSAHSLIRKIEVYSSAGSNLLESIDNYNVLYQACANVVCDVDEFGSVGGVAEGYEVPYSAVYPISGTADVANIQYVSPSVRQRDVNGLLVRSGAAYTFQLPLMW